MYMYMYMYVCAENIMYAEKKCMQKLFSVREIIYRPAPIIIVGVKGYVYIHVLMHCASIHVHVHV